MKAYGVSGNCCLTVDGEAPSLVTISKAARGGTDIGAGGLSAREAVPELRDSGPRDPPNIISKRSGESSDARAALLSD